MVSETVLTDSRHAGNPSLHRPPFSTTGSGRPTSTPCSSGSAGASGCWARGCGTGRWGCPSRGQSPSPWTSSRRCAAS